MVPELDRRAPRPPVFSSCRRVAGFFRDDYVANQFAVAYILGERRDRDGAAGFCPTNYAVDYARKYYYDGPRQRYAVRELTLPVLMNNQIFADSEVFSEYDGDQIYSDFTIDGSDGTVLRSYEIKKGRQEELIGMRSAYANMSTILIRTLRPKKHATSPAAKPRRVGKRRRIRILEDGVSVPSESHPPGRLFRRR